uniref:Zgc:92912 n=1 Tax=Cyprinus carpio TaxID=7962 RepID=A0A8C2J8S3_CYPCA
MTRADPASAFVVLSCLMSFCGCGRQVVDIMRVNVDKVLERDQKLSELDDRADALQAGASQFESCAAKLKNKYWWKNCKMMIIMGVIGLELLQRH